MSTTDVLTGGGDLGCMLRALDWAATPLGEPGQWAPSLRSAVGICLNSRFPIAIYWGPELALLYNEAWCPILGEKHPWALARPGRVVWPEIWAEIGPLFEAVHRTGEGVWQQDQLLPMHRHGYTEECYFNFTFSPIRGEDGAVAGIFNAVIETTFRVLEERRAQLLRDLGERIAGARSAHEVCARAAQALGAGPADLPFCLLYLRDHGADTLQLAAAAGAPLAPALCPPTLDPADRGAPWPAAAALRAGQPQEVALADPTPSGVWPEPVARAVVVPLGGGQGAEPAGLLVAGVSPRRALDASYRGFYERLAQQLAVALGSADAYAAERRRAEALAAIDAAKTAFFSNVSHEFRTPLTLMLGPLEDALAQPDGLGAAQREQLGVAHRNALRLLRLVNTLLDFSRIEAGRARASFEPTDLAATTAELISVFRSAVERAGLELSVDCPPLPAPVFVDRDMWEQIVFNLLSNALKFTFDGAIAVALRVAGPAVELEVRDTGTGIPAEELPRLFERFHRVSGARCRTYEGSGIGLALVQELARLHGGGVRVASALGRGSSFTVSIPLGTAHLPADRVGAEQASTAPGPRGEAYVQEALRWLPQGDAAPALGEVPGAGSPQRAAGGRILLADDNADMRDYVRRLLGAQYAVVAVGDGAAALRAALEGPFDLVLSDVMMPGLDGFGLLRALRADERTRELPVVLLSARAGEEARVHGMEAGADDYLVKPFSARELLARVGARIEIARVRRQASGRERALRAEAQTAREQLEQALAGIADQFFALDHDWRYVFINEHVARVSGLPRERLLGSSIWELSPELRGSRFERELRQAAERGAPARFEYYDAQRGRWFESRVYPAASGVALFVADITEQKRAELSTQFLLEVNELLAHAPGTAELMDRLGAMIGGFFGVDRCSFVEFDLAAETATARHEWRADPADASLVGSYRLPEYIAAEAWRDLASGLPLAIADVSADAATAGASDRHLALGIGAALNMPFVSDGALKFALVLYRRAPYRWRDDEVATLRELAERIWTRVERARAEAALRDAQAWRLAEERAHAAQLQQLNAASLAINAAPTRDALLLRILEGALTLIGAQRAAITRLPPGGDLAQAETIGLPAPWAGRARGVAAVVRLVSARRRALCLSAAELAAHAGDAGWPEEGVLAAPLLARDGACIAVIQLAGRPVGAFGAADEALLQQLAQIAAVALENRTLYEQEQAARAHAEEASRLKDEFLATVSHELRTPLTALLGYSQLLQSRKRDEAYVARTVEKIARSARAQAQITEDLLDIARIVNGKLRIEPRPIDLIAVVQAALETVRPAMEAKGLELEVDMLPAASAIVGDADRLQQVVWNLLSNAAKFTPPGGLVAVRLAPDGGEAVLTVRDTGQGIALEFLPFVFDRFRQADSSSQRAHGGLGLGLSIVRHLVELHGGTATVTSAGGGAGATFTVRLPLAAGAAPAGAAEAAAPAGAERFPPELRGLRVLLVDDQPDILDMLEEALAPCGAVTRACPGAREALATLRAWRPDMVVSDIAMPGEDGYWLIRAIRALPPEAGGATPAVALTAYVRMEDRLRVLEAGFQQYVAKPVEPAELLAVLAGALR